MRTLLGIIPAIAALLISTAPAKAQAPSNEAQFYYWNGVGYTLGNLLCSLAKTGKIEKSYARALLAGIVEEYSDDPSFTYIRAVRQGSNSAKDECPKVYQ